MSVFAGPADWWTNLTDDGRTHIATKGVVQANLIMNLDAGVLSSYSGTGNTWIDLSGNSKNGNLINASYTTASGGAIGYANTTIVPTTLTLPTAYTMSVWFKLTSVATGGYQSIIGIYESNYMCLIMNNTDAYMGFWAESIGGLALGSSPVTANTWYNYVITRSGNSTTNGYKLYVNGIYTGAANTGVRLSANNVYVGNRPDAGGQPMFGNIAIGTFYNKALSAEEIWQNFNALRGRFGI